MKNYLLLAVVLFSFFVPRSMSAEIHPTNLVYSIVRITYYRKVEKTPTDTALVASSGTAWFFRSPKYLVTADHVARDYSLTRNKWTQVELFQQRNESVDGYFAFVGVRIHSTVGTAKEKLVILELDTPVLGAQVLDPRPDSMVSGTSVLALAYDSHILRVASGHFLGIADASYPDPSLKGTGFGLFEIDAGTEHAGLNRGSSGAPLLDDDNRVVGVVNWLLPEGNSLTPVSFATPAPWGIPNNSAIPTSVLAKITLADLEEK